MNDGFRGHSQPNYDKRVRAWVVFDGADGTIRSSENIRAVTRNSTGNYTIELAYPMSSKYWAWMGSCRAQPGQFGWLTAADSDATLTTRTVLAVAATTVPAVAAYDPDEVQFIVVGE